MIVAYQALMGDVSIPLGAILVIASPMPGAIAAYVTNAVWEKIRPTTMEMSSGRS